MLPPKAFMDVFSAQAARLLTGDLPTPFSRTELEAQLKTVLQGTLARFEVVSREEFERQTLVLAHTRARLEAVEQRLERLEQRVSDQDRVVVND